MGGEIIIIKESVFTCIIPAHSIWDFKLKFEFQCFNISMFCSQRGLSGPPDASFGTRRVGTSWIRNSAGDSPLPSIFSHPLRDVWIKSLPRKKPGSVFFLSGRYPEHTSNCKTGNPADPQSKNAPNPPQSTPTIANGYPGKSSISLEVDDSSSDEDPFNPDALASDSEASDSASKSSAPGDRRAFFGSAPLPAPSPDGSSTPSSTQPSISTDRNVQSASGDGPVAHDALRDRSQRSLRSEAQSSPLPGKYRSNEGEEAPASAQEPSRETD